MIFFAPQLKHFEKIVETVEEQSAFIRTNQAKLQGVKTKLNELIDAQNFGSGAGRVSSVFSAAPCIAP